MKPSVEMKGITKLFPGVVANDKVDLTIYPGEVHALLGENGSGKSTLMNILSGVYASNEGEIYLNGEQIRIDSPKSAIAQGIGMVHQHFKLIEPLTVAENIYLALGKDSPYILNKTVMEEQIKCNSEKLNLPVNPQARIEELSVGEQQRVEIVKQLCCGANVLILDEPTAVLTPQETDQLFKTLHTMTDEGKAIIFITHKLFEVMEYSDRITVLRKGKTVGTMTTKVATQDELVEIMVGRTIEKICADREQYARRRPVVELKNIRALDDKNTMALKGLDLTIFAGEIFGLAGVAGNGQTELAEVLTGLRCPTSGKILFNEEDVTCASAKEMRRCGMAYIPEDRMGTGLVGSMNIMENVILCRFDAEKFSKRGVLKETEIEKTAHGFIEKYEIKNAGITKPVSLMSGGNLQKLLLAREICGNPSVIIAAYPVHGVDIGATNTIHKVLLAERDRGTAILLISENLEELQEMSDRVGVIYEGKIIDVIDIKNFTFDGVGKLMAGVREKSSVKAGSEQ